MSRSTFFSHTVRISSWIGDLVLTGLAVWLAIHNRDQMTLHLAFALGLCVVLGGMLPITVYIVDYFFAQNARRLAEARGPENLHTAMVQLDELSRRVEEAARSAAKSTIVARQIPDRIEERFKQLSVLSDRLDSEILMRLVEGIQQLTPRLEALEQADRTLQSSLENWKASMEESLQQLQRQTVALEQGLKQTKQGEHLLKPLSVLVEQLQSEFENLRQAVERDGLVQDEKMESIIERLDSGMLEMGNEEWSEDPLEEELAELAVHADERKDPPDQSQAESPSEPRQSLPTDDDAEEGLLDDWVEEPDAAEDAFLEEEAESAPKSLAPPKKREEGKSHSVQSPQEAEADGLFPEQIWDEAVPKIKLAPDAGRLQVKAFVGISNRIMARGDFPLSWESGTPLKPSGIGEWLLELSGMEDPIEIELRINDELAAQGKPVRLAPGEALRVNPRFPQLPT